VIVHYPPKKAAAAQTNPNNKIPKQPMVKTLIVNFSTSFAAIHKMHTTAMPNSGNNKSIQLNPSCKGNDPITSASFSLSFGVSESAPRALALSYHFSFPHHP